ncbi:peptide ABC transporter substrate-binding protein [Oenococcus sp. UCMA 16435]|nr:peptide ABC transporter substrate-binding protein [Oenococcus sp. UCMA 16435]MDI4584183.1 peptide ABC transporter substrate-binding protein [Oenococcus sp. UCMA 14587]
MNKNREKKFWGVIIVLIIIISAIFVISKRNDSHTGNDNLINDYLPSEIDTTDNAKIIDNSSYLIAKNTGEGLLTLNEKGQPVKAQATYYHQSKDGLTWTFKLRKNLKWSNGDPVTAQNYVYGWQRVVNPKTGSQLTYLFSGIKNANSIVNGKIKDLSSLGIKAVGHYKIVITLEHPEPQFKQLLTMPFFFPENKKIVEKYGKKLGSSSTKQVYDGPFVLTGWNGSNDHFKLIPNKYYWDKKAVKNNGINFQVIKDPIAVLSAYKQGKIDQAILATSQQVAQNKNRNDFHTINLARSYWLDYNQSKSTSLLKDKKLRKALDLAINRKALAKEISHGLYKPLKTVSPVNLSKTPSGNDFATTTGEVTSYSFSLAKAKRMFSQVLKETGKKSIVLNLEGVSDSPQVKSTLDYLAQSWSSLPGLTIKEKIVPQGKWQQDMQNENFDIILTSWSADYSEPLNYLNMFASGQNNNYTGWSNEAYDQVLEDAINKGNSDPTYRNSQEIKAEKILSQQTVISPLYSVTEGYLRNSRLKGILIQNDGSEYYKSAYLIK